MTHHCSSCGDEDLEDYSYMTRACERIHEYAELTDMDVAQRFYNEVCAEAESNMLKTGKLEGSHFAAMQTVLQRWRDAADGN